jgi:radical SAM superfamily enzyme YgiQ (UPF0313 family)
MMSKPSPLIVLTSPSTEMSDYNDDYVIPFVAGFSKPWFVPRFYLKKALFKPVPSNSLEAAIAPLGLRKLEADLVKSGFQLKDIAVVHPDNLKKAVGPDTKFKGISSKDPLGLGYVSLTYSSVLDFGDPINKLEFEKLMNDAEQAKEKYGAKIVVGGAGSWQLLRPEAKDLFQTDIIFIGEGDVTGPEVFWKLVEGKDLPSKVIEGRQADIGDISPIIKPSIYGAVEISRGCGRGCAFCSPTMQKRKFIPIENIVREVELNVSYGLHGVLLVTEDIFMYECNKSDFTPNRKAVEALFEALTPIEGVDSIQVTHANLAAVSADKTLTKHVAEKLREKSKYMLQGKCVATVEVGIETGSPRLFQKYMSGKCKPFKPQEWPNIVLSSLSFMEDCGWVALATILIGLPGETDEDTQHTVKLIENIENMGLKAFLVPLTFVPLGTCSLRDTALKSFNDLSESQVDVFASAWEHNIKVWGPDFFKSPPYTSQWNKLGFKILSSLLYNLKYKRSDKWRRTIADRIFESLKQVA